MGPNQFGLLDPIEEPSRIPKYRNFPIQELRNFAEIPTVRVPDQVIAIARGERRPRKKDLVLANRNGCQGAGVSQKEPHGALGHSGPVGVEIIIDYQNPLIDQSAVREVDVVIGDIRRMPIVYA